MTSHAFWFGNIIVSVVSILVLTGLLAVYGKNFRNIRSTFSVGLILFALLFLIHNVIAVALVMNMMSSGATYPLSIPVSMLALNLAELAGFGILFWISWQ